MSQAFRKSMAAPLCAVVAETARRQLRNHRSSAGQSGTFAGIVLALAGLLTGGPALAQAYPVKTVRILVPYDPGGAVDLTARLFQQRLAAALGQPVVVENRPSGAGKVGAEVVSNAEPDGHLEIGRAHV